MHVIFSHGRGSNPNSKRISHLATIAESFHHTTERVDYTDTDDPEIRTQRLADIVKQQTQPFCLVGSSMGGYASLLAAESADSALLQGLFLMAPALYVPRYAQQCYPTDIDNIEIVHGWDDDVVIYEHSVRYARESKCALHLIQDDHRFNENLQAVGELFEQFLHKLPR